MDPCEKTKNTGGLFAKHKIHVNSVEKAAGLFLESIGGYAQSYLYLFLVFFFCFRKCPKLRKIIEYHVSVGKI